MNELTWEQWLSQLTKLVPHLVAKWPEVVRGFYDEGDAPIVCATFLVDMDEAGLLDRRLLARIFHTKC
jgi:hypothetical protein